ncbi:MAG: hydrogenase maturation protease [Synergistaceae bacterium]|nr:hydrogenase maturation protease [Synergistaceae bacterium]
MSDLQVWCVGNVLLGDDAVGCRVAELLAERGVPAADCGTVPENYIPALSKNPPRALLIVDAADMGLPPGECRKLSLKELGAGAAADSSHGVPLPLLLSPFEGRFEIAVLGIQPASFRLGAPLSDAAEKAALRAADLISKDEWRGVAPL